MGKNDGKRNQKNASKGGGTQKQRGGIKKPKKVQQLRDVPLPEEEGANQEEDLEVSDEDLEFVKEHAESIGFLKELNKEELDNSVKGSQKRDAARAQKGSAAAAAAAAAKAKEEEAGDEDDDDEEEEEGLEAYERGPRRVAKEDDAPRTKGLPIKTMDGGFVYAKDEDHKHKGGNKAQHLAAMEMPKVEGVTVQDEMEESHKIKEARKKEEEARAAKQQQEAQKHKQKKAADAALPPALAQLQTLVDREQRLNKAKEAMAMAANALLSGPEDHIGELRTLTALLGDPDMQVSRLAMLSLLAVFKDIIPGYRIRPPTEKELEVKVSKEVQHLRDYEAALLRHYQAYLKGLLRHGLCVSQGSGPVAHARVAVRCMCQLLTTAPHFNYTSDLLQAVVPRMAASDTEIRNTACSAIRALLASPDTTGKVALEALQLVADLIRRRKCICPPQVVQALSVLRFNQVTRRDPEEKQQKGGKKKEANKKRPRNQIDGDVERDFKESQAALDSRTISKLQSQMLEALFEIYFRVLKQCTASPLLQQDPQQQQTQQQQQQQQQQQVSNGAGHGEKKNKSAPAAPATNTIPDNLATAPSPGVSRARLLKKHPLLYPVLEGLACYTHLISVEYFNDIMDVFHQLLRSPGLPLLERLRVLLTASDILRGQGEALNVDRRESHARLYQALLSVPMSSLVDAEQLAEGSSNSNGQADSLGHQSNKDDEDEDSDPPGTAEVAAMAAGGRVGGAAAGTSERERLVEEPLAVLLAGVLHQTICEPKIVDVARLAAFTKRVATIAMDSGPAEALALLGCVLRLLRRYPRLKSLLEWEGEAPVGGRSFNPELADPSEAGALAAALWELQLLVHHYHPHVAQAAKSLIGLAPGARGAKDSGDQQLSGPLATPGTLRDLATLYATIPRGGFLPPPPAPRSMPPGRALPQAALRRALQQPVSEEWGQLLQHTGVPFRESTTSSWAGGEGDELLGIAGSTGSGAGREEEEAAAAKAMRSQYREARRFADNAGLRRERARLIDQLKRFKVHLHQQNQAPQGAGQVQRHKRAKQ